MTTPIGRTGVIKSALAGGRQNQTRSVGTLRHSLAFAGRDTRS